MHHAKMRPHESVKPRDGTQVRRYHLSNEGYPIDDAFADDRFEQFFLVAKVVEDAPRCQTHVGGDIAHGGAIVAELSHTLGSDVNEFCGALRPIARDAPLGLGHRYPNLRRWWRH